MATMGKPLNNKSFYAASNGASGAPDIAMPPLDHLQLHNQLQILMVKSASITTTTF